MLTPTVARSWAPRGQTPLLRHWQRHDRISVISGISVSPRRRRIGLYYQWHHRNIHDVQAVEFLQHLLRHLRAPTASRVPACVRAGTQPRRRCVAANEASAGEQLPERSLRPRARRDARTRAVATLASEAVELRRALGPPVLTCHVVAFITQQLIGPKQARFHIRSDPDEADSRTHGSPFRPRVRSANGVRVGWTAASVPFHQ